VSAQEGGDARGGGLDELFVAPVLRQEREKEASAFGQASLWGEKKKSKLEKGNESVYPVETRRA